MNEAKNTYFDNLSGEWDQDSTRNRIALNVARTIHKNLETIHNSIMLDFGCGTGLLSLYFYPQLARLDGVDTSSGMVEEFNLKAQKENLTRAKARLFNLNSENLPKNEYEIIVSSMVFHHIESPPEILKKLYVSLKPGGKIAVADLDEEDGSFHPPGIEGVYHHGFSRKKMASWFEEAGFKNVVTQTVMQIEKNERKYSIFLCFANKI